MSSFMQGLISGLRAMGSIWAPPPVSTKIPPEILEPTYRPPEEDAAHIRGYFQHVLGSLELEPGSVSSDKQGQAKP